MGKSEFEKYAAGHAGISSLKLHRFNTITQEYISPTIIEERQMNVATMDVFSRLMMAVSYTHLTLPTTMFV